MAVTVRVQDIAHGCAARGVDVRVEQRRGASWVPVASLETDDEGCLQGRDWVPDGGGALRVVIDAGRFFAGLGLACTQAEVSTSLRVAGPYEEHAVSVLLAPSACTLHTSGPAA